MFKLLVILFIVKLYAVITFYLLLFDCKSTYKENKTAANSYMKFTINLLFAAKDNYFE